MADPAQQLCGWSFQRSVAAGPDGSVHVAWLDRRSVPAQVWYRRYDAARGVWLAESVVSSRAVDCNRPGLAVDAAGDVHLVWHCEVFPEQGVWYRRRDARHGWQAETLLVPARSSFLRRWPVVSCRPGGRELHVVFSGEPDSGLGQGVFHVEFRPDSGWQRVAMLAGGDGRDRRAASVVVDSANWVTVLWSGQDSGLLSRQVCCRRRVGGVWDAVELVPSAARELDQDEPAAAVGPGGVVHAVWSGARRGDVWRRIFWCRRVAGGWGAPVVIDGAGEFNQQRATVAAGAGGEVFAAWCAADESAPGVRGVQFAVRDTAGGWSAPVRLSPAGLGGADCPGLIAGTAGRLHLVWQSAPQADYDVFYRRGYPGGAGLADRGEPGFCAARVWPVPTRGVVVVRIKGVAGVRDGLGRPVSCPVRRRGDGFTELDVSGLPAGVYFVGGAAGAARLVVQ